MIDEQSAHEPVYTSIISPLRQFIILFCIGIGFVGMTMFIPLMLLFGYMVVEGGHVGMYAIGFTALPFIIGVGVWVSKILYREMKKRIIDNKYPSGYDLHENKLSFQVFDMGTNQYIYGNVPYAYMEKCVISVHAEPILRMENKHEYEIEGYYHYPVSHIVYPEDGEMTYFARTLGDKFTTEELLSTLKNNGVPLEITEYDLDSVPRDMLLRVISEDILTEPLNGPDDITTYIDQEYQYAREPEVYMDAHTEWLVNEHGVVKRDFKPWHAIALLILLSLVSALGFMAPDPGFFLTVAAPYIVVAISYMAYIYLLREPKYWKSLFHAGIALGVYLVLLYMTGNDPFTMIEISSDPDTMATLKNKISEAVIGTVAGFYGGSYIFYMIAERDIRGRWPAQFHAEVTNLNRRKRV